jgi:hypothetical protein
MQALERDPLNAVVLKGTATLMHKCLSLSPCPIQGATVDTTNRVFQSAMEVSPTDLSFLQQYVRFLTTKKNDKVTAKEIEKKIEHVRAMRNAEMMMSGHEEGMVEKDDTMDE